MKLSSIISDYFVIILLEIRFYCSDLVFFYCDGNIIKHLMKLSIMLFVQRN